MNQGAKLTISFDAENVKANLNNAGNVTHINTSASDVFVVGTIQHGWFLDDIKRCQHFEKHQYQESFYQKLNGHFSIIIVDKKSNRTRIVANRSGGFRLYIKIGDHTIEIADQLKLLTNATATLSSAAIAEVIDFRWNSGEHSIVEGIWQLPSACYWDFTGNEITQKTCYQYFPLADAAPAQKFSDNVATVERLLSNALQESIPKNSRVAVLLSGGVDSSVLAALAHQFDKNLVAISHRSDDQQNPELATAIQFAKELGIEHQIYTINNQDITDAFNRTIDIIEQPARYQSSLLLYKLFEKMAGKFDHVIYGEAADTLFGSSLVKRYKLRRTKQQKLLSIISPIPLASNVIDLLPKNNKIRRLKNENYLDYMRASSQIDYHSASQQYLTQWRGKNYDLAVMARLLASDQKHNIEQEKFEVAAIKSYLMRSDRDNHFHETGALARHFNIELISPFVDYRVVNYAASLDDESYLGDHFVKPVLREIGCKYFTKHLMYIKKKGFPAPFETWIDGPLQSQCKEAMQKLNVPMEAKQDYELQWTMLCLYMCSENLTMNIARKISN